MNQIAKVENANRGLTAMMAERFSMEPSKFVQAIKSTVMSGNVDDGQLAAFLMVAHQYDLNPLTKEIYAFPSRGGIQPIVSIDGWLKMINSHPEFDGMEFSDSVDEDGSLLSVTCKIYRKDRSRPTEATEYMEECFRETDPWKKWPRRMLRHKAAIQCARYAFSFAGIMDEDDFDRMRDITPETPTAERLKAAKANQPHTEAEGFDHAYVTSEAQNAAGGPEIEQEQHSAPAPSQAADEAGEGEIPDPAAEGDAPSSISPSAELESAVLEPAVGGDGVQEPVPSSPPDDAGDDGGADHATSPAIPLDEQKTLMRYCKDVLKHCEMESGIFKKITENWTPELRPMSPLARDQAQAIYKSGLAIRNGDTSKESAVEHYAEMFGTEVETLSDG